MSIYEKFDLIFSSFTLHHLVSTDKTAFFQLAYSCLNENGRLLLIDVMREEDEADLPCQTLP
jgi:cyclopropane fatty-acyl-phospholipid synthase-like methyltransferase